MEYEIEDPDVDDDEQFSVDELCDELDKTKSKFSVNPAYKTLSPNQTTSAKKPASASSHGSHTIRSFFSPVSNPSNSSMPAITSTPTNCSTPEQVFDGAEQSQEKRPISSLVTALDNDYNHTPKCAKVERESTATATQKCDIDLDTSMIEQVSATDNQTQDLLDERMDISDSAAFTQAQHHENEQMEVRKKKKKSKSETLGNPFASDVYKGSNVTTIDHGETQMDQDGDGGEIIGEKPDPADNDLNITKMSADLFDESTENPKTPESNHNDETSSKFSPTPSKVNDRPRGQFKHQMPRSNEQSSPSSSTVCSTPSSKDMLTQSGTELNSNNDQENSDLNTEADQMKALNVSSDK